LKSLAYCSSIYHLHTREVPNRFSTNMKVLPAKGFVANFTAAIALLLACGLAQAEGGDAVVITGTSDESSNKNDDIMQTKEEQCDATTGRCDMMDIKEAKQQPEGRMMQPDEQEDVEAVSDEQCTDHHEMCSFWAQAGECANNPAYMKQHCQKSCNVCGDLQEWNFNKDDNGNDNNVEVKEAVATENDKLQFPEEALGLKQDTENDELQFPEEAFGVKQDISGMQADKTKQYLKEAIEYMQNVVFANPDEYPQDVRDGCQNRNDLCAFWAAIGECEVNPGYMKLQCAPVCKTCDRVDFSKRCPYAPNDPKFPDAMQPGDLHKMFEKIVAPDSKYQQFKPVIHSRPYTEGAEGIEGQPLEEGQLAGPWILTFDNFLSSEEADILVALGHEEGFERSTDVGPRLFDGTYEKKESTGRTSHNAWCKEECMKNETATAVMSRISDATDVPSINYESFQLLRYEPGQKYNVHHDFIEHQVDRQCGPRILTFFLYLSDVEAGGGTNFPRLGPKESGGITVMPKKGKALLWPSVQNYDLQERDDSTFHQAKPVEAGTKYAANAWIHLRDFEAIRCVL
jgi:prolyl 4-hydroxylase